MTDSISKDLSEAIQKNLPSMFATEMQGFIQRAKADAAEVENLNKRLKTIESNAELLRATLATHADLATREAALKAAQDKLQAQELELLKREAQTVAAVAQAELEGVKFSMGQFLRNVTVRSNVASSVQKPIEGHPGGNGYSGHGGMLMPATESHVTTETQE